MGKNQEWGKGRKRAGERMLHFVRSPFFLFWALLLGYLFFSPPAFAQTVDPSSGLSTFAQTAGFTTEGDLRVIVARLIRTALGFLGILTVVFVLYGGFLYLTSGGADDKVKRAKKVFTNAVIGLVIVFSSFAITQFVLSRLVDAVGGSTSSSSSSSGSGTYADGSGTSSEFLLTSVNTECAEAMMNVQLQFVFSQRVSSTTVDGGGISVTTSDGTEVDGTYAVSGKRVTFTPSATCDEDASEHCFSSSTDYVITLDSSVLESSTGTSLTCSTTYPCSYDFTTGTSIDTAGPSLSMDAPDDGASVYVNDIEELEALATDDTGVVSVDFSVDGDVVYQAGLLTDSSEEALAETNYFSTADGTEWDTAGFSTGTYAIRAMGTDCAGHSDTSSAVSVKLRPAFCDNGTQDEDETGVDCGGDSCGACDGSSCSDDTDCASGACDESTGECVGIPKIKDVSPDDGTDGNLVTISGEGFGDAGGTVAFLGNPDDSSDDVAVSAYECNGSAQWSDTQVIVQLERDIVDGPIEIETSDGDQDRTDDDYGPTVSDFNYDDVSRPGICLIDPDTGEANTSVDIVGNNFGGSQGTSTVYFGNDAASDYGSWDDTGVSAVVPLLNARSYRTQVWSGDYVCVSAAGVSTGEVCSTDDDCAVDEGESCATGICSENGETCETDADCSSDGGSCVSRRQGSNKVAFTVLDGSEGETPVIASVVSGWKACDDGTRCADDGDCGSGSCEAADNWGPPGQYLTIYGTGFGSSTGTVRFDDDLGYANGDMEFPDACGTDFWSDTEIQMKVPGRYTNVDSNGDGTGDAIESGTFALRVETARGVDSEATTFVIRDDSPGPGICDIDPSAGLPGTTTVTIAGDNFGTQGDGFVEFFDGQSVSDVEYWSDSKITVTVDPDAETGPVFVSNDAGYESNSVEFEVGDCNEDSALCGEGESCCADGSCSVSCEEEVPNSHYAWTFSTGDIPDVPRVAVFCGDRDDDGTYDGVSPGPWANWSAPEEVCVNASVTATFTETMDQDSFEGNVIVQKCDGTGSDPCSGLNDVETNAVGGVIASTSEETFAWVPTDNGGVFEPSTTYRVTLVSSGIRSVFGAAMSRDYSWEFTTSSSTDFCEVGNIYVSPSRYSATEEGQRVDYSAQPIAKEDDCVPLSCEAYSWNWDTSDASKADFVGNDEGSMVACENTAEALGETSSVTVEAGPDGVRLSPTDTADLAINFTDPEVTGWTPSCAMACTNAAIRVNFNTEMEDLFVAGTNVRLYTCEDALCDESELTEWSSGDYGVSYADNGSDHTLSVSHDAFDANTWYRLVVSGDMESKSGVALSQSGTNYPSEDNRFFPDDFSWMFKTKDSDVPCSVDRVEINPPESSATFIGQEHLWEAIPYGAPDDCSTSGQALDAQDYSWDAWTAKDDPNIAGTSEDVAQMSESGLLTLASELEPGCSSECLHTGSDVSIDQPVCGDGITDYDSDGYRDAEDCEDGNTTDGDGCSSECLDEGNATACSDTVTTDCCGNGVLDDNEECDDGNSDSGDGCTSLCLDAGSRLTGTTCGDGIVDHSDYVGGEDCDDGNTASGDGCSSNCLFEGGKIADDVDATCGNGTIEPGEDCDDANADDGDGCSSDCLYEGTNACVFECSGGVNDGENCSGIGDTFCGSGSCLPVVTPCCGDNRTDYDDDGTNDAEDCDDGNTDDGDDCSSECLYEGSSVGYTAGSVCGDGDIGTGEECDADSGASYDLSNWGVSIIQDQAAQDVLDGTAGATITATESSTSTAGTGTLTLSCSCESDDSCGNESDFGCGTANCCYGRPQEVQRYPADGTEDVCRNTAIWVDFTQTMDANTFDSNLYLELTKLDGETVTATNCPESYTDAELSFTDPSASWIARAWHWMLRSVRALLGRPADAATYACLAPVTYSQAQNDEDGSRVSLTLSEPLQENGTYRFVVVKDSNVSDADDEGVLSGNAVGIDFSDGDDGKDDTTFTTGSEICELEKVVVEDLGVVESLTDPLVDPSLKYFTESGEQHQIESAAYTIRGGEREAIAGIPNVYDWSWAWNSSCADDGSVTTCTDVVDMDTASDFTTSVATAAGNTGRETIVATATLSDTNTYGDSGAKSGLLQVTANVCGNPPTVGYPYEDETSNFSFFYCRDAGGAGDTSDDLPELDSPVDVTSYSSDIIQELVFQVADTPDAIGVRVLKNSSYLPPDLWYEAQGFTGSPADTEVDGYEAVQDGNTVYVAAANDATVGSKRSIYPNIYVISYTENADDASQEIFDQILKNWTFNANVDEVTDVNLCVSSDGTYSTDETGAFVSCEWDGDCLSLGSDYSCDADKAKLTRDMRRLTDLARMQSLLNDYADANGYCSVTTDETCTSDDGCPGDETCEPATPKLADGTFVNGMSASAWPSWSSELGNALGEALPEDPLNAFYDCTDSGYESDTCWNSTESTFACPDESHVYAYQSIGGTAYRLNAQLEYDAAPWSTAIDPSGTFEQITAEYDYGGSEVLPPGFSRFAVFCNGRRFGNTAVCGDGIIGSGERCEIGETSTADCDSDGDGTADGTGTITVTCGTDCRGFQSAYEAEVAGGSCVSYECGNGVVEADNGEECDDGALNGTYGHCGDDCTLSTAFSCGDGYLTGGEQCDCGGADNFHDLVKDGASDTTYDSASWAYLNRCTVSNGQWQRNPAGSCSWDCKYPGPSCGDGEVNGAEACDGDYETWDGALCVGGDDDGEACSTNSDCDSGVCGSSTDSEYEACGSSRVCVGGDSEGVACTTDDDCPDSTCSTFTYDLTRSRTCQSICDWATDTPGGWTECVGGTQYCGNGTVEGDEECDDGNSENTDACTNDCLANVCGDGYVYSGVESCDDGSENGATCDASYAGTCNFCTTNCQYRTSSGSYCGDGVMNGTEVCDGTDVPYYCFDNADGAADRSGTCDPDTEGSSSDCDAGYTCRWVGVCNGGSKQGEPCTLNPATGNSYRTDEDADTSGCGTDGECVAPTCADDCSSMCPFSYETVSVLAQTEEAGADPQESVDLYDYLSGNTPDNAVFYLPACSVASELTADVNTDNVEPPSVDIVFLTDFTITMGYWVDGEYHCEGDGDSTLGNSCADAHDTTDACGTGTCSKTAPAGYRRIDYVSEATVDSVATLFDELGSAGSTVRASAISFYGGAGSDAGYNVDQSMTDDETDLETQITEYQTDDLQLNTPHYKGLQAAVDQLASSDADTKAIILLSDGLPTHDKNGEDCTEFGGDTTYSGSGTKYCIQEIAEDLLADLDGIQVYTAAITTSGSAEGYMAHISSDACGTDYGHLSDCAADEKGVEYAYQAEDADGIAQMYDEIISSVLGVTVGLTTEVDGAAQTTSGSVTEGHDQSLPFPDNFDCTGSETTIPFTVSFNGDGYMTLSDITFSYCPAY